MGVMMVTNGLIILAICLLMRLAKRYIAIGTVWALLSIAYFIGAHVGVALIVIGLLRG